MEKCEICKEQGIIVEFKDGRGLGLHLKAKHDEMKLEEYRTKYKKEEVVEREIDPEEIPDEETMPEIIIKDYKLLNKSNLFAMFVDEEGTINTFKKVIAIGEVSIGDIETNNTSIISAMIIGNDGLLTPTFIVPGFARIVERDTTNILKKKSSFFSKLLKGKSKKIPSHKQKTNENLSQDLITQFSKHLHNKNLKKK